ncbi:MAG: hypothetical protein HY917_03735 [Candidatus Diapherotrites archaeon]|nr:hypothetical protein [Candidatus Diapherotrites archaeon]
MALLFGREIVIVFIVLQVLANHFKWYQKHKDFDVGMHFLGGLALAYFISDWVQALFLILLWEAVEIALIRKQSAQFRETWKNKVQDIIVGFAGFLIGWRI